MKITQDVRDYAETKGIADETAALAAGMDEMSKRFREGGGEVYRDAASSSGQLD